jgi:hypothetical protein
MKKNERDDIITRTTKNLNYGTQNNENVEPKKQKKLPEDYFSFNENKNEFKEKVKKTIIV